MLICTVNFTVTESICRHGTFLNMGNKVILKCAFFGTSLIFILYETWTDNALSLSQKKKINKTKTGKYKYGCAKSRKFYNK